MKLKKMNLERMSSNELEKIAGGNNSFKEGDTATATATATSSSFAEAEAEAEAEA
jgi:hypothetical protein|tara:strand:- start:764 stop:928 length:165 start_codon:yes stop_codon:yes gene_type:complete